MDDNKKPATKADIHRLDVRMDGLETRMDRLETKLDKLAAKIDTKFDTLQTAIDQVLDVVISIDKTVKDHERRITRLERHVGIAS